MTDLERAEHLVATLKSILKEAESGASVDRIRQLAREALERERDAPRR